VEIGMRSYPLNSTRSNFSRVFDRALAGEPQRVTRYGKEAVIIVSEAEWATRSKSAPNLGEFLARFAENVGFDDTAFDKSDFKNDRQLGVDFD
jgi:prevent-host-death family protein